MTKSPVLLPLSMALLLGCMTPAATAVAATTDPMSAAQPTAKTEKATPGEKMSEAMPSEQRVEERIKDLHSKLKITAAQEPAWTNVAEVMRDNEKVVRALITDRHENAKTMSAIDDLQSYEKIARAHADGLEKFIPIFQALYDAMDDAQKQNADVVFGRFEGHPDRAAHHGKDKK